MYCGQWLISGDPPLPPPRADAFTDGYSSLSTDQARWGSTLFVGLDPPKDLSSSPRRNIDFERMQLDQEECQCAESGAVRTWLDPSSTESALRLFEV